MKTLFLKLVMSSHDPEKVSQTIKGMLISAIPVVALMTNIDEETLRSFADLIQLTAYGTLLIIGALETMSGLVRKVRLGRWTAYGKSDTM